MRQRSTTGKVLDEATRSVVARIEKQRPCCYNAAIPRAAIYSQGTPILEVIQLDVSQLEADEEQPRKHLTEESLHGLADSLKQHGMLSPITVSRQPHTGRYTIVTGERRWRAARIARLRLVPCIIAQVEADERLTIQLIENLQREDLLPIEKARALHRVKDTLSLTNRELAVRLGLSERVVAYHLELLDLPAEIGDAIVSSPNRPSEGRLTEKHARFLRQLNESPDVQSAVVDRIRDDHLSSDDTGQLVRAIRMRPEQAQEILTSPMDHLVQFLAKSDTPWSPDAPSLPVQPVSNGICANAQAMIDLLPRLSGIKPQELNHRELRELEDALSSVKIAVDGLLTSCRRLLGGEN